MEPFGRGRSPGIIKREAVFAAVGNFRQHVGVASTVGVAYAWATHAWCGVHWLYGSMAALLATIGGVLPDIDHPLGVEVKALTTFLGTIAALVVWKRFRIYGTELPFEAQIWAMVFAYALLRRCSRGLMRRLMVHRGMAHSIPTCLIWGAIIYLVYPSHSHPLRVCMSTAVMAGFLSHLGLDEVCSVDLKGQRVKRSFGTAIKLWGPSLFATLAVYVILYFLIQAVLRVWPNGPFLTTLSEPIPPPSLPSLPEHWQLPFDWLRNTGSSANTASMPVPAAIGGTP